MKLKVRPKSAIYLYACLVPLVYFKNKGPKDIKVATAIIQNNSG